MALLSRLLSAFRDDRAAERSESKVCRAAISLTASGFVTAKVSRTACWEEMSSIADCMVVGEPAI